MDDLTKKINELYKKSKTVGLTDEEKALQKELREKYLANVRRNFRATLENVRFTDGRADDRANGRAVNEADNSENNKPC